MPDRRYPLAEQPHHTPGNSPKPCHPKVLEVEHALDEAAQQGLVDVEEKLLSVQAPPWLHMSEMQTPVIAPKPKFVSLD